MRLMAIGLTCSTNRHLNDANSPGLVSGQPCFQQLMMGDRGLHWPHERLTGAIKHILDLRACKPARLLQLIYVDSDGFIRCRAGQVKMTRWGQCVVDDIGARRGPDNQL